MEEAQEGSQPDVQNNSQQSLNAFSQLSSLEDGNLAALGMNGSEHMASLELPRFPSQPQSQPASQDMLFGAPNPALFDPLLNTTNLSTSSLSKLGRPNDSTLASGPAWMPQFQSPGCPSLKLEDTVFNSNAAATANTFSTAQYVDSQQRGAAQAAQAGSKGTHYSLMKPEHKNSRATRRGPMDEMRQLVRILVKLLPDSLQFLAVSDEGGGGNRVSEDQIKEYLRRTLGKDPPEPEWGLPAGWGEYLAILFSWATGRHITKEQAMGCARRLPGRSWEAVDDALLKLGLYPHWWPLPLTIEGIRNSPKTAASNLSPPLPQLPPLSMMTSANAASATVPPPSLGTDHWGDGSVALLPALLASGAATSGSNGQQQQLVGLMGTQQQFAGSTVGSLQVTGSTSGSGQTALMASTPAAAVANLTKRPGAELHSDTDAKGNKRPPKRRPPTSSAASDMPIDPSDLTELDCWRLCASFAAEALRKAAASATAAPGTSHLPTPEVFAEMATIRQEVRRMVDASPAQPQQQQQLSLQPPPQQQQQLSLHPATQQQQLQQLQLPPVAALLQPATGAGGSSTPYESYGWAQMDFEQLSAAMAASMPGAAGVLAQSLAASRAPPAASGLKLAKPQALKMQMGAPDKAGHWVADASAPQHGEAVKVGSSSGNFRPYMPLSAMMAPGAAADAAVHAAAAAAALPAGLLRPFAVSYGAPRPGPAASGGGAPAAPATAPQALAPGFQMMTAAAEAQDAGAARVRAELGGVSFGMAAFPAALPAGAIPSMSPTIGGTGRSHQLRSSLHDLMESAAERGASGSPVGQAGLRAIAGGAPSGTSGLRGTGPIASSTPGGTSGPRGAAPTAMSPSVPFAISALDMPTVTPVNVQLRGPAASGGGGATAVAVPGRDAHSGASAAAPATSTGQVSAADVAAAVGRGAGASVVDGLSSAGGLETAAPLHAVATAVPPAAPAALVTTAALVTPFVAAAPMTVAAGTAAAAAAPSLLSPPSAMAAAAQQQQQHAKLMEGADIAATLKCRVVGGPGDAKVPPLLAASGTAPCTGAQ